MTRAICFAIKGQQCSGCDYCIVHVNPLLFGCTDSLNRGCFGYFPAVLPHPVHMERQGFRSFAQSTFNAVPGLDTTWKVRKAHWDSLEDVRKTYPSADGIKVKERVFTVFNIHGNKFRLITKIEYLCQKIFIKQVLTHAEYDKEDWKK